MDKELFKQKQDSSYAPKITVVDGEMHVYCSDKFKRLEASSHEELEHREEQIINYYKQLREILNSTEENK